MDLLEEISGIIESEAHAHIIFGGDLNCNVHKPSVVSKLISDFMSNFSLRFVDKDSNPCQLFTFSNSRQQTSYIDFFLVSESMLPEVQEFAVIEHALNLSDHRPVQILLTAECINSMLIDGIEKTQLNCSQNFALGPCQFE
jgi:endonuclease/exonuclease/phosphatase family metal-dependent hydrolase